MKHYGFFGRASHCLEGNWISADWVMRGISEMRKICALPAQQPPLYLPHAYAPGLLAQTPQLKALLCHIWLLGDFLFIITSSFVTYLCQDVPPGVEEPEVGPGEDQVPQGGQHHCDGSRQHQNMDQLKGSLLLGEGSDSGQNYLMALLNPKPWKHKMIRRALIYQFPTCKEEWKEHEHISNKLQGGCSQYFFEDFPTLLSQIFN